MKSYGHLKFSQAPFTWFCLISSCFFMCLRHFCDGANLCQAGLSQKPGEMFSFLYPCEITELDLKVSYMSDLALFLQKCTNKMIDVSYEHENLCVGKP